MKLRILAATAAVALAAAAPASAATYMLNYNATSGSPLPASASITITTADVLNGAGGYDIVSATGSFTLNGTTTPVTLSALNPPGFTTDNVFFASDPHFSNSGLGLQYAGGWANLWGNGPGAAYSFYTFDGTNYGAQTNGTLEVTGSAVPEPAGWALLVGGFGLVGVMSRRRKTVAA